MDAMMQSILRSLGQPMRSSPSSNQTSKRQDGVYVAASAVSSSATTSNESNRIESSGKANTSTTPSKIAGEIKSKAAVQQKANRKGSVIVSNENNRVEPSGKANTSTTPGKSAGKKKSKAAAQQKADRQGSAIVSNENNRVEPSGKANTSSTPGRNAGKKKSKAAVQQKADRQGSVQSPNAKEQPKTKHPGSSKKAKKEDSCGNTNTPRKQGKDKPGNNPHPYKYKKIENIPVEEFPEKIRNLISRLKKQREGPSGMLSVGLLQRDPLDQIDLEQDQVKRSHQLMFEDLLESFRDDISVLQSPATAETSPQNKRLKNILKNRTYGVKDPLRISYVNKPGNGSRPERRSDPGVIIKLDLKKTQRTKKYWDDNIKIFQSESVVCIVSHQKDATPKPLAIAQVAGRRFTLEQRGELTLQLWDRNEFVRLLLAPYETLKVVQLSGTIFAHKHVLSKLHGLTERDLPSNIRNSFLGAEEGKNEIVSDLTPELKEEIVTLRTVKDAEDLDVKLKLHLRRELRLDTPQREAVASGLSRRLSLIQGPPGTGKSLCGAMVGRLLYDELSRTASTKAILCVCVTNHAVDQYLEDLLDMGVPEESIVRLGGNKERIAPRIRDLMLDSKANGIQDKGTKSTVWKCYTRIEETEKEVEKVWREFEHVRDYLAIKKTLENLLLIDGFKTMAQAIQKAFTVKSMSSGYKVAGQTDIGNIFHKWIQGETKLPFEMKADVLGLWDLPKNQRNFFAQQIRCAVLEELSSSLFTKLSIIQNAQLELRQLYRHTSSRSILSRKYIIGCTSAAAAKYEAELNSRGISTVIIEEAGEMLEPQLIAVFPTDFDRLVLIGDHKQLRPQVNSYSLQKESGRGFNLNVSSFERLVVENNFPHDLLEQQHRMHQGISLLVRTLIYPKLRDADSVHKREIKQILRQPVVFWNHSCFEATGGDETSMSRRNPGEADLVKIAVEYLLKSGVPESEIAVLTTYLGQVRELRKSLDKLTKSFNLDERDRDRMLEQDLAVDDFKDHGLRLATVDNFQGEEARYVIVSLVRSNSSGDIGFLKSAQRLNVLLSRARDGMILVGNLDTFTQSQSEIWVKLEILLRRQRYIFDGLPVQCPEHVDQKGVWKNSKDVNMAQLCRVPAEKHLKCGHVQFCACSAKTSQCTEIISGHCSRGHKVEVKCCAKDQPLSACDSCRILDEEKKARKSRERKLWKELQYYEKLEIFHKLKMEELEETRKHQQHIEELEHRCKVRDMELESAEDQRRADIERIRKIKKAELEALTQRIEMLRVAEATCVICMEDNVTLSGREICCSERHLVCGECSLIVAQDVFNHSNNMIDDRFERFKCPVCDDMIEIDSVLDKESRAKLKDAAHEKLKVKIERETEERIKREQIELGEVQKHTRIINETILTLKCPNGHAFHDFTGCCALQCGICRCHFCALCLQESPCSQTSHAHLMTTCKSFPDTLPRDVFVSDDQFQEISMNRKSTQVRLYLLDLIDPMVRRGVRMEILKSNAELDLL